MRVERCGAFRYVYSRIYQAYGNPQLVENYQGLMGWLRERCRYDLGIGFPLEAVAAVPVAAECAGHGFSMRDFAAHRTAVLQCVGDIEQVSRAWQYLYRVCYRLAGTRRGICRQWKCT